MPNLNIPIDASLLREINYAASKEELTQRDFVIKVLAKAVGLSEPVSVVPSPRKQGLTNTSDGGTGHPVLERQATEGADRPVPQAGVREAPKISAEEYADLSPSEQLRAMREGKY